MHIPNVSETSHVQEDDQTDRQGDFVEPQDFFPDQDIPTISNGTGNGKDAGNGSDKEDSGNKASLEDGVLIRDESEGYQTSPDVQSIGPIGEEPSKTQPGESSTALERVGEDKSPLETVEPTDSKKNDERLPPGDQGLSKKRKKKKLRHDSSEPHPVVLGEHTGSSATNGAVNKSQSPVSNSPGRETSTRGTAANDAPQPVNAFGVPRIRSTTPRVVVEQPKAPIRKLSGLSAETAPSTKSCITGKVRVGKRKRNSMRNSVAVVLQQTQSNRRMALVRSMRRNGRSAPFKKDYMQILLLRQQLDQHFKTDLPAMLNGSAKALTTSDWQVSMREKQDTAIVKRVYDLQGTGRWSYRQPKPFPDFPRPKSHQDHLLSEMKWLHSDFREERKYKIAMAKRMAYECCAWVQATETDRKAMTSGFTRTRIHPEIGLAKSSDQQSQYAHNLDSRNCRLGLNQEQENGILASEEGATSEAAQHVLMRELQSNKNTTRTAHYDSQFSSMQAGKDLLQRLPVPRDFSVQFISDQEQMEKNETAPRAPLHERQISTDLQNEALVHSVYEETRLSKLPPEDTQCALFDTDWEGHRKRLNLPWPFKPPSGPYPPVSYLENRRPSQWTKDDDSQLRTMVKECPSNWELIADRMCPRPLFASNLLRRTPWECYERWLQLEGQTADQNNRAYMFRYQQYLDKIRARYQQTQAHSAQHQQMQQQVRTSGQQSIQPPVRFPSPIQVDRKPNKKFVGIIEAARKLARRRESAQSKQQHMHQEGKNSWNILHSRFLLTNKAASVPDMKIPFIRKDPTKTPQALSHMKHERQMQENKRQEQYRQQQQRVGISFMAAIYHIANV